MTEAVLREIEEKPHKERNPITGRNWLIEDEKKGLALLEKKLEHKPAHEKIKYLQFLLKKNQANGQLTPTTVDKIEEIISDSYSFFGNELLEKEHFEKAAKAFEQAGNITNAKKAWKQAGDACLGSELSSKEESSEEKSFEKELGEIQSKEQKIRVIEHVKKKKSKFASAAEFYTNAGEEKMAETAWSLAGDDYLAKAEKGDRRYFEDAYESYKKGNNFKMAIYVGLMSGKTKKEIEQLIQKSKISKKDLVKLADTLFSKRYTHAANFLYEIAKEQKEEIKK